MKKIVSIICILAIVCTMMLGLQGCGEKKVEVKATIGILALDSVDSYSEILNGFKDSLESRYQDGEIAYVEKSANGDAAQLNANIQALVDEGVNAIVTLGDEASVAAVEKGLSVPVFFLGVTDAVGLGLTSNLTAPDKNATGAVGLAPVDKLLADIAKLTEVNSFGILYDANNGASKASVELLVSKLEEAGLTYEVKAITTVDEAKEAAASLAASYDALFLPEDATIQAGYSEIIAAAGNTPVFACEENAVQFGAVLAVVLNQRELGGNTGQSAYAYLNGKAIAEIPVFAPANGQTYINQGRAVELGYTLNDEFLNTATLVNKVSAPAVDETVAE